MTDNRTAYQELEERFARRAKIRDVIDLLHWDAATMMPDGGAEARAGQLATVKGLAHEMMTDPALGDYLDAAAEDRSLDAWQQANLREMRHAWIRANALDRRLVERMSDASLRCEMIWREAKAKADYAMVRPALEDVLALTRERAGQLAAALGLDPYDALLDGYEPGGRAEDIDVIFAELAKFLPDFIGRVLDHQAGKPLPLALEGPFDLGAQRQLCRRLMQAVGFDFHHGRLDESHHPFCGGVPEDVRLTTRYETEDFMPGIMGVLHETGHALYDQGLPAEWRHQPVGEARSMSIHESQSLMIEMQASRSRDFIDFAAPLMREAFGGSGPAWEPDNIHAHYIRVERSLIRVDADEVTYPTHVILRYRLERALIAGDMTLADLPAAWNDGMKELLGLAPPNDGLGCLQDLHWYAGSWGYFPTYTLGAMSAAQLFQAARRAVPDIPAALGRGDFRPLLGWLRAHVHGKGSRLSTRDLLAEATGRPLDPRAFEAHLTERYLA
ncbi:MAG: carboxypeptidase M32 [Alphaproteobacteria bacterium]